MVFSNVVGDVRSDDEDDEEVEAVEERKGVEKGDVDRISGALESVEGVGEGKKEL